MNFVCLLQYFLNSMKVLTIKFYIQEFELLDINLNRFMTLKYFHLFAVYEYVFMLMVTVQNVH